jgi:isopenicillin-N N-acyltransferase-like protein
MSTGPTPAHGDEASPGDIPVIDLHGSAAELGYEHGSQLREAIGTFYEALLAQMCADGATNEDDLLSYARGHLPAAKEYAPELTDEILGIADGSGLSADRVLLMNCYDEVSCHGPRLLTTGPHGCTAFAATGRATSGGACYVGQSWDVPPYYPPYLFRLAHDDGTAKLMFCHPGMIGGAGVNSEGLALAWTTLRANDAGLGVPAPFVVRKALDSGHLGAMLGAILSARRANGMGFIAGDTVAAVNVELSATRYSVEYSHGTLGRANHYESPSLLQFEDDSPVDGPDTILRSGRMKELLACHSGSIEPAVLMDILCDHASRPGCICYHEFEGWRTCAALICDPQDGVMWVSNGPPCESGFRQYTVAPATEA